MENINEFFSLNASEVSIQENNWVDLFLPGWNGYKKAAFNKPPEDRENIIINNRTREFYDLDKAVDYKIPILDSESTPLIIQPKLYNLFAVYSSSLPRKIIYYEDFYVAREEIKQIVRIHERMHAYHHVNKDGLWKNFETVSPVYKEFLAQLFTFKCVENTYLQSYFINLSKGQPSIYQTWVWAKEFSQEHVIDIFEKIKSGKPSEIDLLDEYAKLYSKNSLPNQLENDVELMDDFLDRERAVINFLTEFVEKPAKFKDSIDIGAIDVATTDAIHEVF